jgi:hypothetical protein
MRAGISSPVPVKGLTQSNRGKARRSADVLFPSMPYVQGPCRRPLPSRWCFAAPPTRVESSARYASTRSSFTATTRLAGVSTPSAAAADSHWAPARRGPRRLGSVTTRAGRGVDRWRPSPGPAERASAFPRCSLHAGSAPKRHRGGLGIEGPTVTPDDGVFSGALVGLRRPRRIATAAWVLGQSANE